MPRKKRSRNNDDREPDDGRPRLPKRIPDSTGYVTWKKRPFGTLKGGPDSAPTGVSSELDFSRTDDETTPTTPSIPSASGSSSPPRLTRATRNRRQRRSDGQNASGSASPATSSSESTGPWSPATGHSSTGPGPSPLREHFSPSMHAYSPISQQNSPIRQHSSPIRQKISPSSQQHTYYEQQDTTIQSQYHHLQGQQHTVTQSHHSPTNQLQRHGRFHPYQMTGRAPATAPQVPVPPGVPWPRASEAQEVAPHPAPVVNMSPEYSYTEAVADDAQQQWVGSALGFDAYGETGVMDPSSSPSHSLYRQSTTQEQAFYTPAYIPQQILPHLQNIPDPSFDYSPYTEQSPTHQPTPHTGYSHSVEDQPWHMAYESTMTTYPQQAWNTPSAHATSFAGQPVAGSSQWAPFQWSDGLPNAGTLRGHVRPTFNTDFQHSIFHPTHPSDDMRPSAPPPAQRFSGAAHPTQGVSMQHSVRRLTPSGHDHQPVYLSDPYAGRPRTLYEPPVVHSAPPTTSDVPVEYGGDAYPERIPSSDARRSSV